jgi:hypothetical protein
MARKKLPLSIDATKVTRRQRRRGVVEIKGTDGGEYTLNGQEYRGLYHLMKDGTAMAGRKHRNRKKPRLLRKSAKKSSDLILQPIPKQIEKTEDVTVTSTTSNTSTDLEKNTRVEIVEGDVNTYKVGNFTKDGGSITLFGDYEENQVSIPTYDLSNVNVIDDPDVTFDFVLCLKDGEESEPKLYATSTFYNALIRNYNNNQPFQTNDIIDQKNIVVVDIKPIKERVEQLRQQELNQDINLTNSSDKKYVEVYRNLFVNSNYSKDDVSGLKATPTYTLIELLRYISWVVSKPAQNYDDRLIPANLLGDFGQKEVEEPKENEPSKKIEDEKDDDGNSVDPSPNLYPPIGRKGVEDEEEEFFRGRTYTWNESTQTWERLDPNTGDPKGGGGRGGDGMFDRD